MAGTGRSGGQTLHRRIPVQSLLEFGKERQKTQREILQGQEKVLQGQEEENGWMKKDERKGRIMEE